MSSKDITLIVQVLHAAKPTVTASLFVDESFETGRAETWNSTVLEFADRLTAENARINPTEYMYYYICTIVHVLYQKGLL